jgi:hypothetical protein
MSKTVLKSRWTVPLSSYTSVGQRSGASRSARQHSRRYYSPFHGRRTPRWRRPIPGGGGMTCRSDQVPDVQSIHPLVPPFSPSPIQMFCPRDTPTNEHSVPAKTIDPTLPRVGCKGVGTSIFRAAPAAMIRFWVEPWLRRKV